MSASWRIYGTFLSVSGLSPTFAESLICRSSSSTFAESVCTISQAEMGAHCLVELLRPNKRGSVETLGTRQIRHASRSLPL
jgi:hypothetical protein